MEEIKYLHSITPNYTYSSQGQEKLRETGWSSYKWRNYDAAMGRFFNVDPLSEKYAYQSHFNFAENRVVDGRELEGLEWASTHYYSLNGSQRIENKVRLKVENNSSLLQKDAVSLVNTIVANAEKTFTGTTNDVSITTKFESVQYVNKLKEGDYGIKLVDKVEGGSSPMTAGLAIVGDSQSNIMQVHTIFASNEPAVGVHEMGHSVGMNHESDPKNLMDKQPTEYNVTNEQLETMKQNIPTKVKIETNEKQFVTPLFNID
ncbi:matrixin family metalloprotease [Chryseobacterium sp. Bi04]|uniref:matrixin family metalloprotease n=1 Tax=Chryseobacterium sp. Bi04 TaxID=2822345 RepID=UPI001DEBF833|nr:matrixin family metalloprotease [Chryseobacterium sp. Bi04]CAH0209782.1 hypothetical protein SRABI04_02197 [Chryseobacterium sp. Bi04]